MPIHTLNRGVLAYASLIERRLRSFRKPHCGSIRIDETYVKIRSQWRYLYRAIDKHGMPAAGMRQRTWPARIRSAISHKGRNRYVGLAARSHLARTPNHARLLGRLDLGRF